MDVQKQNNTPNGVGWRWNRGCKVCGKRENLKKCTKCNNIYYCSKECQKLDFKEHKENCKENKHFLELLSREDPKDPCPICLDQECDEGMFLTCYQCGASFCGNCITSKNIVTIKGCPVCRNNEDLSNQKILEYLIKSIKRGVPIKRIYPSLGIVKYGIKPTDPSVIVYLTQALEKGAHRSGYDLANILEKQDGDKDMIFELHKRAASWRIHPSQNWMAKYFLTKGDKENGIHWHTRAYENGNLDSTKWLADYYLPLDELKSIELYKQAGENGCSVSIFTYAKIMEQKGVKYEAFINYIKCMLFIPEAYYRLGEMYSTGYPEKSLSKSFAMYVSGAKEENINCLLKLAHIFLSISNPLLSLSDSSTLMEIDPEFRQIISEQDPEYMYSFSTVAITYLDKAIQLGSSKAAIWLGDYHISIKNYDQAIATYHKAFDLGDPEAYIILGKIYISDQGVPSDIFRALFYLEKAVEAGSKNAEEALKVIIEKINSLVK